MTRPSRSGLLTAGAVLAVLALLVVAGRWSQGQLDRGAEPAPIPGRPPATTIAPTGVVRAGDIGPVDDVAVGPGAVWAASGATITRFDSVTGRPTATVEAVTAISPPPVLGVTVGPGALWVTAIGERLLRVDPQTARVVARVAVVPSAAAAVAAGSVWVPCCEGDGRGRLARVDPATNRVVVLVALPGMGNAVGAGPGGVWVRGVGGRVWRVDPTANKVVAAVPVPTSGRPGSVAVTRDAVWLSDPDTATVVRIDRGVTAWPATALTPTGRTSRLRRRGGLGDARHPAARARSGRVLGPGRDLHELSSSGSPPSRRPDGWWLGTRPACSTSNPNVLG